jgi:predicted Zn-dependent protease with MMP-like domain
MSADALPPNWNTMLRLAQTEVRLTLEELPGELREAASALPVVYEPAPSPELVEAGYEPDTLGLFTGAPLHEEGSSPEPAHITLFLQSLWSFAEHDPEIFQEEVHITYLHELGHYLGLGEEDLDERGLQ